MQSFAIYFFRADFSMATDQMMDGMGCLFAHAVNEAQAVSKEKGRIGRLLGRPASVSASNSAEPAANVSPKVPCPMLAYTFS